MPDEKNQTEAEESLRRWFPDAFKEQDAHKAKLKEMFTFPTRRLGYSANAADYIENKPHDSHATEE